MKNLKNKIAALSLMAVLGMGATAANAGILLGDKSAPQTNCGGGGIVNQLEGIIIVGLVAAKDGIMMSDLTGILMGDVASGCTQNKDGILIVGVK